MISNSEQDCFSPDSALIANVCYIHHRSVMVIEFKKGGTYEYANVPPETYEAMTLAPSAGKFFYASIKPIFAAHNILFPNIGKG